MNSFSTIRRSGFSLIEMMIGIAVMAIVVAVAVPNFKIWLMNAQIRNAAESIQNGLQRARAEAVARNTNVEFVLQPVAANDATSWIVQLAAAGGGGGLVANTPIDKRSSAEGGSTSVTRTIKTAKAVTAASTTITFDNTGRPLTTNPAGGSLPGSAPFDEVDLDSSALDAAISNDLRVTVDFGGAIRMCDPNVSTGPRACI